MKFKIVNGKLILIDSSLNIVEGENNCQAIEIEIPQAYRGIDMTHLSFRFTVTSVADTSISACQVLYADILDDEKMLLYCAVTEDFSSIIGSVVYTLIGVDSNGTVAKFISIPHEIINDISTESIPDKDSAKQLFNQTQLEVQKAIKAADDTVKMLDEFTIDIAAENTVGGILSGGDISVSESGNVTVLSVNEKTLGTSVPENAVFTDTVYTLPKATKTTLGGVKVDGTSIIANKNGVISAVGGKNSSGKIILPIASPETLGCVKVDGETITATEDGTISVLEDESIKAEISGIKSSQNTMSNLAVQIAHPNNFLIYDDMGKPSVMVAIPKFYLDEVIDGASHTVHPAFIINGVEQDVIYISKYQNIVENGRAYSLPMKDPAINVDFDTAYNCCKAKGNGWHLMTNAEWAAIALWCKKNGTLPKGNNNYGKDISESTLPLKAIPSFAYNNQIWRILTGSGPASWYHNGTFSGIADLNGNIMQWVNGFRLYNGEIQIIANNDAADFSTSSASDSAAWKAILPDGTLVAPGTSGTVKYSNAYSDKAFAEVTVTPAVSNNGAILLESLGLIPHTASKATDYNNSAITTNNVGEHLPFRGLYWNFGEKAGVFSFYAPQWNDRSFSNYGTGFRSAYCELTK